MDNKERKKLHRWEQKNRWMAHYEIKYGVQPIEFGAPVPLGAGSGNGGGSAGGSGANAAAQAMYAGEGGGAPTVLKAKCRFCECFGREALASAAAALSGGEESSGGGKSGSAGASASASGLDFPGSPMGHSDGNSVALDAMHHHGGNSSGGDGSGAPPLKRRKKRQTLKVFGPNFRTDNLESHLTREHPVKWKEYERLRDAEKKVFFPEGPDAAKEQLLLAQQVAVANAAAMNAATSGITRHNGGVGGQVSGSASKLPAGAYVATFMEKSGAAMVPIKHVVTTEIMDMVEQLLASRLLRQQCASRVGAEASAGSAWQQFVRDDERTTDAATAAGVEDSSADVSSSSPSSSASLTGECRAVGNEFCTISIKNEALFNFIVDALDAKLSLEATLAVVHSSQRLVPEAAMLLTSLTTVDVASAVHQLVGLNLSCISQLMSYAWGYSLFLRFATHHGTGFVDLRVQIAVNDDLQDLHLISIPLDAQKHSVESLCTVIVKTLTVLDARAMEKVVGLTIDGDHYHMRAYKDIGSWLKKQAEDVTQQAAFYVLHSGAYHLSYIVEELLDNCQADLGFLTALTDLEAVCRRNTSLLATMGPEPTRFASSHWTSIYNACEWLTIHRETIVKWCSENQQMDRVPPTRWWITLFVLRDILKDVFVAYKKCRESSLSFADVQKHLRDLIFQIRLKFNIKPTMTTPGASAPVAEGTAEPTATLTPGSTATGALDPCEFAYPDFVNAVIPLDLFMYEAFQLKSIDGISDEDRISLYERFNVVLMLLINKVLAVVAAAPDSPGGSSAAESTTIPSAESITSSDPASAASVPSTTAISAFDVMHQYAMEIPPSTPYEFITINNLTFMELLHQQRFRICSKWTGKVLSMITDDRNRIMSEFAQPGPLYDAVTLSAKQHQSGSSNFRDTWKPFALDYSSLCSFAIVFGGLLSVTKTTDEELERYYATDKYRVPNLTLEAQLHAAQYHKVSSLRRHVDSTIV